MKIGTRGSPLALWQAEFVKKQLMKAHSLKDQDIEIIPMTTKGDQLKGSLTDVGGKGLFTKELEVALLEKHIDIAVHSMKDVATVLPEGLVIPCVLEREDPRDAWVSERYATLDKLPAGAVVGTASLRRTAQLLHYRPDVQVKLLRGNVQTRLEKIKRGEVDGTFLAYAGLKRLGLESVISQILDIEEFLPAVAQGALGIECRAGDEKVQKLLKPLNHQATFLEITAERAFLKELDGNCRTPIGAYAKITGDQLILKGFWATEDGSKVIQEELLADVEQAVDLGKRLGQQVRSKG